MVPNSSLGHVRPRNQPEINQAFITFRWWEAFECKQTEITDKLQIYMSCINSLSSLLSPPLRQLEKTWKTPPGNRVRTWAQNYANGCTVLSKNFVHQVPQFHICIYLTAVKMVTRYLQFETSLTTISDLLQLGLQFIEVQCWIWIQQAHQKVYIFLVKSSNPSLCSHEGFGCFPIITVTLEDIFDCHYWASCKGCNFIKCFVVSVSPVNNTGSKLCGYRWTHWAQSCDSVTKYDFLTAVKYMQIWNCGTLWTKFFEKHCKVIDPKKCFFSSENSHGWQSRTHLDLGLNDVKPPCE